MRIRLTIDIERRRPSEPSDEQPAIYDVSGSATERAAPHPIGFVAEPGRSAPIEWDDRR